MSSGDSPATEATGQEVGSVQLRVELGAPGFLARAQAVRQYRIERLVFRLLKSGDTLPTEHDTIDVSDPFYFSHSMELDIRFQWRVELQALDSSGRVRYEGGESFQPKLKESTSLDVTLHPKEYELRLMLLAFEGISRVEVSVGDNDDFAWSIDSTVRTGDTIILSQELFYSYSYRLPSASRWVRVSVYGSYFGAQKELFSCDTNLYIRYGQDSIARLKLKWVGGESGLNPSQYTYVRSVVPNQPLYLEVGYPRGFLPIGDSGVFVDVRDGELYGFKRFGDLTWMTENLRYKCENCDASGAKIFNPEYAVVACPVGWRIPQESDWQNLIEYASLGGGSEKGVIHLMTNYWYSAERMCGYEDPMNYPEDAPLVWSCGEPTEPWFWGDNVQGDDSIGFHLLPTARSNWTPGHVSESYDYSEMWSRWSGGMSIVSFVKGRHSFSRNTMGIVTAPAIRCVAD
ncbi:MAG TPA: FISUMP domain-containing protein [Fibrobacteria bacterium]|nr:FISUMP domain-containing protein [Fibrobacteria bacterium]